MRSQREVQHALDALDDRIDTYGRTSLVGVINKAKRDTLEAILDGRTSPTKVITNCREALRQEMDLTSYLHVQAAMNTAAWAHDDLDSL